MYVFLRNSSTDLTMMTSQRTGRPKTAVINIREYNVIYLWTYTHTHTHFWNAELDTKHIRTSLMHVCLHLLCDYMQFSMF